MALNFSQIKPRHPVVTPGAAEVFATYPVQPRQDFIVPDYVRAIRVVEGAAWVTIRADDYVLKPGDTLTFDQGDAPIVTALSETVCVIELLHN